MEELRNKILKISSLIKDCEIGKSSVKIFYNYKYNNEDEIKNGFLIIKMNDESVLKFISEYINREIAFKIV